ncbi:MAG: SMR family transporter [Phormidesmis sp.]
MANPFFTGLILATVGLNTIAQILFKYGAGESLLNAYFIGGVAAYGLSTLVYISILSKLNLSVAYPVVIGLTVVATTVAGTVLLREKISFVNWSGIGLVIAGIFAIAYGRTL